MGDAPWIFRCPCVGIAEKEPIVRIAVIEDDAGLRQMITFLLGDEGFAVIPCALGAGAHATIARERPDVVLLDLRLEESRTGLAVLEAIRDDPRTRDTAVILCSGDVYFLREHTDELRAQRCGIIEKPFDITELLAMIRGITSPSPATAPIARM